jgi:hypothetical protein
LLEKIPSPLIHLKDGTEALPAGAISIPLASTVNLVPEFVAKFNCVEPFDKIPSPLAHLIAGVEALPFKPTKRPSLFIVNLVVLFVTIANASAAELKIPVF